MMYKSANQKAVLLNLQRYTAGGEGNVAVVIDVADVAGLCRLTHVDP